MCDDTVESEQQSRLGRPSRDSALSCNGNASQQSPAAQKRHCNLRGQCGGLDDFPWNVCLLPLPLIRREESSRTAGPGIVDRYAHPADCPVNLNLLSPPSKTWVCKHLASVKGLWMKQKRVFAGRWNGSAENGREICVSAASALPDPSQNPPPPQYSSASAVASMQVFCCWYPSGVVVMTFRLTTIDDKDLSQPVHPS
ncbi:uncharacterized protein BO66DRAFT_104207 [Aspergillus aculeatinus CBS 121060]|uniref:Uncharacterized protein n=1 Tax=Aspergillus aculeatinus CBS 121060 TaxID=1448322 RepID=A0ACD1H787_9EURO|nr:hypothetical protein BO66DRAFT_104207 [Aspergillus aculeatinus CBS 121060]RAH69310.1 hypothetical protein BO66DRAFT_104207 [Aspergillus aculeatinus CBS 121060]